jgi:zinc transport system ATP-binding protein
MSVILTQNIGYTIASKNILEAINITISPGEYVGLIGPNGAGKTTLIKILIGLIKPTTGSVQKHKNMKIGYVSQLTPLSSVIPVSVQEVLSFSGITDTKNLIHGLERVGLNKTIFKENFHTLSGGQKQRVIIARALCANPEMLIFDEPLNNVDMQTKIQIYQLLSDLNSQENLTILFVSHEVDHIIGKCDRILCLNKTLHEGCHPLDFAKGKLTDCDDCCECVTPIHPIHHHHKT